jgi:hypothetical protein
MFYLGSDHFLIPDPDPGSKKAPDPGSGTLVPSLKDSVPDL